MGSRDVPFVVVGVLKTEGPTAIKAGNKAIILQDGSIEGWVGGHCTENEIVSNALDCLKLGSSRSLSLTTCQGGRIDVYMEPYLPKRKLLIFGHVPIASALSRLARSLNFIVILVDKGASKERFPDADYLAGSLEALDVRSFSPSTTFAVIATMGERDQEYAEKLSKLGLQYIGIVAGKKRASEVISYLRSVGLSEEELTRVKTPAGIYIRAVTAEEIALSIMSEIVDLSRTTAERKMNAVPVPNFTGRNSSKHSMDPVCGMAVDADSAQYSYIFHEEKVYFCSEGCRNTFVANPEKYFLHRNV